MRHGDNPYAPPKGDVSGADDVHAATTIAWHRLLYALLTGVGVTLLYLFVTMARIYEKGQSFRETPWFAIALIAAAFFVVTILGALLASFINRTAFRTLSRRKLVYASTIAVIVLSVPINGEFAGVDVPDWLMLASTCVLPGVVCALSLVAVRRLGNA
jgi:hypothetical protein